MPERKSIYFQDDILDELRLRIGHRGHKTSTVVTDSLWWYFRLLRYVGVSEMGEVFTLAEVRAIAEVAAGVPPISPGGLEAAKDVLVSGLKARGAVQPLVKKVSGLSPAATIWLWDGLTILLATPAEKMNDDRVSALFRVCE